QAEGHSSLALAGSALKNHRPSSQPSSTMSLRQFVLRASMPALLAASFAFAPAFAKQPVPLNLTIATTEAVNIPGQPSTIDPEQRCLDAQMGTSRTTGAGVGQRLGRLTL